MFSNGKISLPSSTKTSLHERFSKMASSAPSAPNREKTIKKPMPLNKPAPMKASVKNRNLAMQMANKPSVQAALKIKNKTLKQRTGGGFVNSARKPNPAGPKVPNAANRNLKARLGGVVKAKPTRLSNRLQFRPNQARPVNAGNFAPLVNANVVSNTNTGGGLRKQNSFRKLRNNRNSNPAVNVLQRVSNNTGFKNKNKSPKIKNLRARVQNTGIKKFGTKKFGPPPQTKKNLDMDLEEYMSKTKSHLDSDLDKYMAKSKSHLDADLDSYMSKATQ